MRPGEVVALRRRQITLPTASALQGPSSVVIAILRPKTRLRAARFQAVCIRDHLTLAAARRCLSPFPGDSLLIPDGAIGFRRRFDALLLHLGADNLGYSPGSLRGGGVVADFVRGRATLTDIMFHGRWDSTSSVSHYVQLGLAALATAQLSDVTALRCSQVWAQAALINIITAQTTHIHRSTIEVLSSKLLQLHVHCSGLWLWT